jgi:hypothetical protein
MFSAMLPNPNAEPGSVPAPTNASTLVAQSRMAAGRVLKAQGRQEDALQMFAAAAVLGPQPGAVIPKVGNGRGETNYAGQATGASAAAMLELAKHAMRSGDYQAAFRYVQTAGQNSPPPELRREINEINMAIVQALNRRLQDDRTREYERQRQELIRDAQLRMQQSAGDRQRRLQADVPPWQNERITER